MTWHTYPQTVREVLNPRKKYRPAALAAVRRFARSKPWRGTIAERKEKFRRLNRELAEAYAIRRPRLIFRLRRLWPAVGNGCYCRMTHTIMLEGKLSVVTYLHEFGHARGFDERDACRFSINLFARCFPRSFARCQHQGHMLVQPPPSGERGFILGLPIEDVDVD